MGINTKCKDIFDLKPFNVSESFIVNTDYRNYVLLTKLKYLLVIISDRFAIPLREILFLNFVISTLHCQ
jgi:hypothetical protein